MKNFILVSHGTLAEAAKETLGMFCGNDLSDIQTLCLTHEMSPEEFSRKLKSLLPNDDSKIIIICDIPGGTPCNESLKLAANSSKITVLSCLSIPFILELYLGKDNDNFETWIQHGFESAQQSFFNLSNMLNDDLNSDEKF